MAFKLMSVEPSKRKFKKFKAFFHDAETNKHKTSHFGDNRYTDFTILSAAKDPTAKEHRDRYRERHDKDLAGDATSPGILSYMLLWNKPTLQASIASYKKLFHM